MYGKLFDSMYDGTLYGQWEAIVTFQQMIVLSDADGVVDMTPQAMAARTSIPFEIIKKGIAVLEAPDPYSRTPGQEGRRIELLDEHRPWGWHIVNHAKYKMLVDAETVREQNRERQRRHREKKADESNAASRSVTPSNASNAQSRHTDTDTDTDTDTKKNTAAPDGAFARFWATWPKNDRKGAKGECLSRWKKLGLDAKVDEVLAHVEHMRASEQWTKDNGQYIPAPLAYLRKRAWEGAESTLPNDPFQGAL